MPLVRSNGIELETELTGPADGRPLVLISGLGSQLTRWKLDSSQVRSSIARKLGLDVGGLVPIDRNVEGISSSCWTRPATIRSL